MRSCWVNWKAVINWLEAGGSSPDSYACHGSQSPTHFSLPEDVQQLNCLFLSHLPEFPSVLFFSGLAAALVIVLYSCILHNNWGINRSPFQSLLQQVMFCVSKTFLFLSSPQYVVSKLQHSFFNIMVFLRDGNLFVHFT